jgi:hypothetical protein
MNSLRTYCCSHHAETGIISTIVQGLLWKTYSYSSHRKKYLILWNLNMHYQKRLTLDPILSQLNIVHILAPHFFKIHFNTHSSTLRTPSGLFHSNSVCISHVTLPAHPPWFDHVDIWWREQIMKLLIMEFSKCCYFKFLRSPQHFVLKSTFLTSDETQSFTFV